jgi:hypothetical protein
MENGKQTPPLNGNPAGEQTPQNTVPTVDPEKEQLNQKIIELEAQKEHWRTKYERDITSVPVTPEPSNADGIISDEGQAILKQHIAPLQQTIQSLEDRLALKDLQAAHPQLKELSSEFEDFRKEYPRTKLENVAKLFLSEKGFLEPKRPGLEQSTGGPRVAPKVGMTLEEFDKLRDTNFRLYQEMVQKGQVPTA